MNLVFKRYLLIVLASISLISCNYYNYIYKDNVKDTFHMYITENTDYNTILRTIEPHLKNIEGFKWVAERKKYPKLIKPGRYLIKQGESNNTIVNRLRIGDQDPVKLKLDYQIQTINQLAHVLEKNLDMKAEDFLKTLSEKDFVKSSGLKENELLIFFFPDTYEFYWNITPNHFINKMKKQYDKFWTSENREKAKNLGLSLVQIYTLATIVQGESSKKEEQTIVAGLYLNRLKNGIKLQADPTVKYAVKEKNGFDKMVNRIYYTDLLLNSPFNTYKVSGLPPAPITMASKEALTSTLNAKKHKFIYMCADPKRPGYHTFEETYEAHEINAQKYRKWANENGVN